MSLEQLKAFLGKVQSDRALQERLKSAKSSDEVASIANEHGHQFATDKLGELSEAELDNVAGGANLKGIIGNTGWQGCGDPPLGLR